MLTPSERWSWTYCEQRDRLLLDISEQAQFCSNLTLQQLTVKPVQQRFAVNEAELFWQYLEVPAAWAAFLIYAVIVSSYVLTAGIALSGIFGASKALPIAGAGHSASKSRETIVSLLIYSSSLVMALAFIGISYFTLS